MEKKTKFSIWYVLFAFWGVLILHDFFIVQGQPKHIPYSDFLKALQNGQVTEVVITQGAISGKMKPAADKAEEISFRTFRVDPEISDELAKHNVNFRGQPESTFLRDILSWVIPVLIFFGLWFILMRRFNPGAGIMTLGKNKAKVYAEKEIETRFNDVAGADEAKEELQEMVDFLKS